MLTAGRGDNDSPAIVDHLYHFPQSLQWHGHPLLSPLRPPFLFVDHSFNDFVVHRRIADPRDLGRHFRPMQKGAAVTCKTGPSCGPLRIIVGCHGIPLDQLAGIILEKPPQLSPPFNPCFYVRQDPHDSSPCPDSSDRYFTACRSDCRSNGSDNNRLRKNFRRRHHYNKRHEDPVERYRCAGNRPGLYQQGRKELHLRDRRPRCAGSAG